MCDCDSTFVFICSTCIAIRTVDLVVLHLYYVKKNKVLIELVLCLKKQGFNRVSFWTSFLRRQRMRQERRKNGKERRT